MIEALGIVVPAHDEEALIAGCVSALQLACAAMSCKVQTYLVLVLDQCGDNTRVVAERCLQSAPPYACFEVSFQNVGRARAHGARRVLEHFADYPPDRIWLATTDADSRVPTSWLQDQLAFARQGFEAIAGTVRVHDWTGYTQSFVDAFVRFYERHGLFDAHAHVHGANLGVRADAYLAAGGFAPLATGEDHALWDALRWAGRSVLSTRSLEVETSSRSTARASLGFSQFLAEFQP